MEEIRIASRYPKFRAILQPHLVGKMLNAMLRTRIVEDSPRKHSADDPTDAYLLNLAEFAKVNYMVTGDKRSGLLKKRRVAGVRILSASEFCNNILV